MARQAIQDISILRRSPWYPAAVDIMHFLAAFVVAGLLDLSIGKPLVSSAYTNSPFSAISSGCSTTGPASCHNTTVEENLCCFESPGGQILQTQFWDTDPATGPTDSWTIHGLWPDYCDGSYPEDCDPSRDYTDISSLLKAQGASSTLSYMEQYWLNDPNDGSNEEFWEHEWATHGTCYSTLRPSCLPAGSPKGAEAVAFYETVVKLFKTLPTYKWLADGGVTPSSSKTYTLTEILSALKKGSGGYTPELSCSSNELGAVYWYFNLKGSVIDGEFVPISYEGSQSGCSSEGIKYLPKKESK